MSDPGASSQVDRSGTIRLLAVDDDRNAYEEIVNTLGRDGPIVFDYCDSVESLNREKRTTDVHVCVVDNYSHGVSRIHEVIEVVERRWPDVPVIVLSNFAATIQPDIEKRTVDRISKPSFHMEPSLLRRAFIEAIQGNPSIDEGLCEVVVQHVKECDARELLEFPSGRELGEICVGTTTYPLRRPAKEIREPGRYSLEGFAPHIVGTSDTIAGASKAFASLVHDHFQRIQPTRKRFRSPEDVEIWTVLEAAIDLDEYDSRRSVRIPHEIGFLVSRSRPGVRVVRWDNGQENEVACDDAPREFASLGEGTWFKAMVQRNYATGEFEQILFVSELSRSPIYPADEREAFWNQPKANVVENKPDEQ